MCGFSAAPHYAVNMLSKKKKSCENIISVIPLHRTRKCLCLQRSSVCSQGFYKTLYSLQLFKLYNPHLPLPPNDLLSEAASNKQRSEIK